MRKNKNLKLIVISLTIFFFIILGISLIDQSEKSNLVMSYDFEDDEIGAYPNGFVGVLRDTNYTRVIYLDEIHGQVVEIRYLEEPPFNPIIGGGMEFNALFGLTAAGTVEFDIYVLHAKRIYIDICQTDVEYDYRDDIAIRMPLSTTDDYIAIMDDEGEYERVKSFSTKVWYHFKIEYDIEIGWSLWIDHVIESHSLPFYQDPPYMCQLYFATYELGQIFYVDNVKITLEQPSDYIYPLDVYIPIIILISLSMVILFYHFKSSKLKRKTTTKRRK